MRSTTTLASIVAVGVVAATIVLLRPGSEASLEGGPVGGADDLTPVPAGQVETDSSRPSQGASANLLEAASSDPSQRSQVSAFWVGTVSSSDGRPLGGAQVDWLPRDATRLSATSAPSGSFSFEGERETRTGAVLATRVGFLASGVALEPGMLEPGIVLDPCPPLRVRVTCAGRPVPSATVVSRGDVVIGGKSIAVERELTTDLDGRCEVAALPGASFLQARAAEGASEVWAGVHAEARVELELELLETITAKGRVQGAPSGAALREARVVVRKADREGRWDRGRHRWRRHLARANVEGDAAWMIPELPWQGPGDYVFRLEGPSCLPAEKVVALGDRSREAWVDLEWNAGDHVVYHVRTEDGQGIAGAEVVLSWNVGGHWTRSRARADELGSASFQLPPVALFARGSAPGFADRVEGPYTVADGEEVLLVLRPGARVTGRCTARGNPVTDFRVTYWGGDATERMTLDFEGRTDGSFEIPDAPSGTVHLFATASDHAPSAIEVLHTTPATSTEVDLELRAGLLAQGRVLDGARAEPVVGASVEACPRWENRVLEPWGPRAECASDGAFHGLLVPMDAAAIRVSAPGYQERNVDLPERALDGIFDLGIVTLQRTQTLTVQLVGAGVDDYRAFRGQLYVAGSPTQSAADGRLEFEHVSPGQYYFLVHHEDGSRQDVRFVLRPGEEWSFQVNVRSEREITLRVRSETEEDRADSLWARATYFDTQRAPAMGQSIVDGGIAHLGFLRGTRALIEIIDDRGACFASQWFDLPSRGGAELEISLDGRDVELLFFQADGTPLVEPMVAFTPADQPFGPDLVVSGDVNGRVTLRNCGFSSAYARVAPATPRILPGILVELGPSEPQPIVVRVDLSHRIRVRLVERGVPMPGIPVGLAEPGDWRIRFLGDTQSDGTLEIPDVGAGTFELSVRGGGCWPDTRHLSSAPDPVLEDVEVRRMGGAELSVRHGGLPVTGVELAVRSLELDADVAEWAKQGRAQVGPTGLVTDVAGIVRLQGLPNGPYRWEVDGLFGTFVVEPWTTVGAVIELP